MTTTQTGGGNGAAPDGGTQGQPRIVPTKPGWWWARWAGMDAEMVWSENIDGAHPAWQWLAPIPGPAVLAALARYGEALHAVDTRWSRPDDPDPNFRFHGAVAKLHAAIRAERDAERDGGA